MFCTVAIGPLCRFTCLQTKQIPTWPARRYCFSVPDFKRLTPDWIFLIVLRKFDGSIKITPLVFLPVVGHHRISYVTVPVATKTRCSNNDSARVASRGGHGDSVVPVWSLAFVGLRDADGGGDQVFCFILPRLRDEVFQRFYDFIFILLSIQEYNLQAATDIIKLMLSP